MCMPKARSLAYPRPLSGLHYGAAAPRLVMATCRLSISAPPELSPFYGDSDYYQPGFSHHGHERARRKSLKTNLAEVINKRRPAPVMGQSYLGNPGLCRFTLKTTLVRISFPAA